MRIAAPLLAAVFVLTGCIGSISRSEFVAEVNRRGGGLSADRLVEVVDQIEQRTGPVRIRSATISHMSGSIRVSPDDAPQEVDTWSWSDGRLTGPTPVGNASAEELDSYFTVNVIDPDRIEAAIDTAIAQSGLREPWADSVGFSAQPGNSYEASFTVTNRRESQRWLFGPDGIPRRQG